jgi:RecB family exonuclease
LEVLQSAQFVTVGGQRLVALSAEDWDAIVEWLEDLEDAKIAKQSLSELKAANGDRKKAGWLEWSEAEE